MLLQNATHATELNMRFPPKSVGENERLLNTDEITASSCTGMARQAVEDIEKRAGSGWKVDLSGETVSQSDEFGFVYRYRVPNTIEANGKKYSNDIIYVVWSKDCKSLAIATFPTLELNLPRSSKGR